jgi:hypothetical protein
MRTLDPLRGLLGRLTGAPLRHAARSKEHPEAPDEARKAQAIEHADDDDRPRPPTGLHPAVWPR